MAISITQGMLLFFSLKGPEENLFTSDPQAWYPSGTVGFQGRGTNSHLLLIDLEENINLQVVVILNRGGSLAERLLQSNAYMDPNKPTLDLTVDPYEFKSETLTFCGSSDIAGDYTYHISYIGCKRVAVGRYLGLRFFGPWMGIHKVAAFSYFM